MINSYTEYIKNYIQGYEKRHSQPDKRRPLPGEHHFVCTYLVPLLWNKYRIIPTYINPDGTKDIPGDIVFLKKLGEIEIQVGIEVKLNSSNSFSLTAKQIRDWVYPSGDKNKSGSLSLPVLFIGISKEGVIISKWRDFKEEYQKIIKEEEWVSCDNEKKKSNGPRLNMKIACQTNREILEFPAKDNGPGLETKFTEKLFGFLDEWLP